MGAHERSQFTFDSYRAGQLQATDFEELGSELDIVEDAENANVLRQVREAVVQLQDVCTDMGVAIPAEGMRAVQYMGDQLRTLPDVLGGLNERGAATAANVGDVNLLPGSSSVVEAISQLRLTTVTQADMNAKNTELMLVVDGVEEEMGKEIESLSQQLIQALGGISQRLQALEAGGGGWGARGGNASFPPQNQAFPSQLPHDVTLQDAAGTNSCTMGELVAELAHARADRKAMAERLEQVEAATASEGAITFGRHQFSSEKEVLALVLSEDPGGLSFAGYPHANTIFVHDFNYEPKKGWREAFKAAIKTAGFEDAENKFLSASSLRYPFHYTSGGEAVAGKLLAAFASSEAWAGDGGIAGAKELLTDSLTTAQLALGTYVSDKLPPGSRLTMLATDMSTATFAWYGKVHAFFDEDLKTLVELGVDKEETLKLLSEYVILMFDVFYKHSQKMMKYSASMNRANYTARAIWVSLCIHVEMEKFTSGSKMKHNSTLSAAFMRFLTKSTAANSASSLGAKIKTLEKTVSAAGLKTLKTDVATSKSLANKSQDELAKVKDELAKLKGKKQG